MASISGIDPQGLIPDFTYLNKLSFFFWVMLLKKIENYLDMLLLDFLGDIVKSSGFSLCRDLSEIMTRTLSDCGFDAV